MKRRSLFSIYCIFIMMGISIVLLPFITHGAKPDVTLHIDEDEAEVDVSANSDGMGEFNGTVVCNMKGVGQNVQSVKVELHTDCEWPSGISPYEFTFEPGGESTREFTATVRVPNYNPASQGGTMEIWGLATPQPGTLEYYVDPIEGIIKIKPYSKFTFVVQEPSYLKPIKAGEPGEKLDFILQVRNRGNFEDTFRLSLADNNSQIDKDWSITFSENDFTLDEQKEKMVEVTVEIPDFIWDGRHRIVIECTSCGSTEEENQITQFCTLYVDVEDAGIYGLGTWSWYALFIILAALIGFIVWKRKSILARFKRNRKTK